MFIYIYICIHIDICTAIHVLMDSLMGSIRLLFIVITISGGSAVASDRIHALCSYVVCLQV